MSLFAIVMLPKPTVPCSPVTVKANVVVDAVWFVVRVMLEYCEAVMLPLIARVACVLSGFVACMVFGVGVGVGVTVGVGVGVGVEVDEEPEEGAV